MIPAYIQPILDQLDAIEANMLTRQDAEKFATKNDLVGFATKDDLARFATKDDLANFATKDDLKMYATKQDLKQCVTTEHFNRTINRLEKKIDQILTFLDREVMDNRRRIIQIENKIGLSA